MVVIEAPSLDTFCMPPTIKYHLHHAKELQVMMETKYRSFNRMGMIVNVDKTKVMILVSGLGVVGSSEFRCYGTHGIGNTLVCDQVIGVTAWHTIV